MLEVKAVQNNRALNRQYRCMQVLYMPDVMRIVTASEDPSVSLWSMHRGLKCALAVLQAPPPYPLNHAPAPAPARPCIVPAGACSLHSRLDMHRHVLH